MNKKITETIPEVVFKLREDRITEIKAVMGFDASIDNIVRVVSENSDNEASVFFNSSTQFGEYLVSRKNRSCGIELRTRQSKIGGNMVITGNALGNLGFKVDCIGTFGLPELLPIFRSMSPNCTLQSIGQTITTTALEFTDSKVMMFDPGPYDTLTWEGIRDMLGKDYLIKLFSGKQLVSLLNWSEIENSSLIWKGILDEILPFVEFPEGKLFLFTDFSDCSRRSKNEIRLAIDLLANFSNYFKVVISLNQNEAELLAKAIDVSVSDENEILIKSIYNAINADVLIIHRSHDALGYDGKSFEECETFFCKEPTVLTGGGDNFNAGICFTLFQDFDLFQSLLVANAISGYYVKTGKSPEVDNLIEFLLD